MSDSDSVIIETKLRSGSDLDEGIRNLSLLDTDDNLKFELESGKKERQQEYDGSCNQIAIDTSKDDYVNKYYCNVPRRINSAVSEEDEEETTTDNTTSETDTVISSGDIFQLISSDNRWIKEDGRVPAVIGRNNDTHEKYRFSNDSRKVSTQRLQRGTINDFYPPNIADSHLMTSETDVLKRQLVQYRVKVKALTEILKQVNFNNDQKLQATQNTENITNDFESHANTNIEEVEDSPLLREQNVKLVITLEDKNKELIRLKEELVRNKDEYETMLEEVNDYLQHNENISNDVSNILKFLLDNMDLTAEERDNLIKAAGFESTFIDIKIKALSVNVDKIVRELRTIKNSDQSSGNLLADQGTISPLNDSRLDNSEVLDSKLELAIETMHEKYHDFLQSIQLKLEKNDNLEKALKDKLQQQKLLLESMSNIEHERTSQQIPPLYLQRSQSDLFSSIDDLSKRASIELSKSYQDHVDALNSMLQNYKRELEDKEKQLGELRSQLRNSYNTNTELDLANKIKEQSLTLEENSARWHTQRIEYESRIEVLQDEKKDLSQKLIDAQAQMQMLEARTEEDVMELRKKLKTALRKSTYYMDDNQLLQEQLEELGNDHHILQDEIIKLREHVNKFSDADKGSQQLTIIKSKLLDHLRAIFGSFEKVLQKESIDQAFNKLHNLEQLDSAKYFKKTIAKLDSVFFFIESAIESIVTEHVDLLLNEKEEWSGSSQNDEVEKQSKLKIDELRKKWIGERERRKLESEAATNRINMLQLENQRLREQLGIQ